MRRITLALALSGAVAGTGCSGGGGTTGSGGNQGVPGQTFTITIQNGQNGAALAIKDGYVTSSPPGIDCGLAPHTACSFEFPVVDADADGLQDSVTLTATAVGTGKLFLGWAGDCSSLTNVCTVTGWADKYVLATFGTQADRTGHPNWSDLLVHENAMKALLQPPLAGTYQCANCHGPRLTGAGLAPSCFSGSCHAAGSLHAKVALSSAGTATATNPADGAGAYDTLPTDATGGPRVTAVCITCHAAQATSLMATQHWKWRGSTPQLVDLDATFQPSGVPNDPGTIGKENYVNNYCVSVASNERRCDQCHAGYGNPGTNASARSATYIGDQTRVDCLICHSGSVTGNMAAGGYNKIAGAFGAAGNAVGPGTPWATGAQLKAWATTPQLPTRENCGWCHFNGGGADSVKIMSTALRTPPVSVDVHMSTDAANGGQNLVCADCHAAPGHRIKGAGIHVPTNTGRLACADCHGEAPHPSATMNDHVAAISCETCHIPAYSRGMPGKIDWDWSTAGWKTPAFTHPATLYACVTNTTEVPYDNNNCLTAGGVKVKKYDYMKGTFAWGQNVPPVYAWYDGTMSHVTTADKGAFTIETGLTPAFADRITLAAPLGARGNGKIFPFKVMMGRQAVYVDDAGGNSFVITPNLFHDPADGADGGFWGVLSAQPPSTIHSYEYTSAVTTDAFGAPAGPLDGSFVLGPGSGTATAFGGYTFGTPYSIETLLSKAFTRGATLAGQYTGGTMARFDGTNPGWDWRYTKMYLDLEHEVAPASQAIGAGGNCTACHGASPAIPICQLYGGVPAAELPWGVTCP
jgi:hypothetical protein